MTGTNTVVAETTSGVTGLTCALSFWTGAVAAAAAIVSGGGAGLADVGTTGAESATGTGAATTVLGTLTGAGAENVLSTPAAGPVSGRTVLGISVGIVLGGAALGT